MAESSLDRLLKTLSEAPPDQIDPKVAPLFKALIGCDKRIVDTELNDIYDILRKGKASKYALWVIENAITVARTED